MKTTRINQLARIALLLATPTAVFAQAKTFPAHWGEPPSVQTRDIRPLPGGFGEGSGTLANWIEQNLEKDSKSASTSLALEAKSFNLEDTGYYLDKGKWLAINPDKNKSATAKQAFPFPSGRYDITLDAVGEKDGKCNYTVAVNDQKIGDFECPLSEKQMEEGLDFHKVWQNQQVDSGDIIAVGSTIASADGKEYSRGRWAKITFTPADDATRAAVKANSTASKPTPTPSAAPLVMPRQPDGKGTVEISGELKQWHKVTLTLDGPYANELDKEPNPFTDNNLTVTFTHESGTPSYKIPGYFAADGNAGESSAQAGTRWRAHLSPDKAGTWTYTTSFTRGKNAALDGGGTALAPFDGIKGTFTVAPTDKAGRDFRGKGRLEYVGKHHLQFAGNQEYFFKVGADAPETLLAYTDFDNTQALKKGVPLKTWSPHLQDFKTGDPTWKDGKGKGLIGAVNYLAQKGVNAMSFLTYNAGGDGDNVWPFVSRNEKLHYDCSKLDQWGIVFNHATNNGIYLHFKLQENEIDDQRRGEKANNSNVPEALDGGKLGPERKLYCREIIARFGHELALNWNIGEENTQSTEEINDMINYIRAIDPYQHHAVLHTFPGQQDKVYKPLLGAKSKLTGVSLQNSWNNVHEITLEWLEKSTAAGTPWVVANDEQNGADTGVPPDTGYKGYNDTKEDGKPVQTMHDIRRSTLWGNLMAGGGGVEYYFGYKIPENDLKCEDWRSRDQSWNYGCIAIDFLAESKIPFWEMKNANTLIGNSKDDNSKYCLAKAGELYLVYLPKGGSTEIDLSEASGNFSLKWLNPREGGKPSIQGTPTISGGSKGNLTAPSTEDWLAILSKQ